MRRVALLDHSIRSHHQSAGQLPPPYPDTAGGISTHSPLRPEVLQLAGFWSVRLRNVLMVGTELLGCGSYGMDWEIGETKPCFTCCSR